MIAAFVLSALPVATSSGQRTQYSVDIIDVCGGGYTVGTAVGEGGTLAGFFACGISPDRYPLLWSGGRLVWVPLPQEYTSAEATDALDGGTCAGWMEGDEGRLGLLYANGVAVSLPFFEGDDTCQAYAVAQIPRLTVVGFSASTGFGGRNAVRWTDGRMQDLGVLPGCITSYGEAITNCGEVVGHCEADFGLSYGFFWKDGVMTKLDDVLSSGANVTVTAVWDINDAGQIAGSALTLDKHETVAILLTPIPQLPGDLDCDGAVAGSDLSILLGQWGTCAPNLACASDLNGDSQVGGDDLAVLLGPWTG